MHEYGDGQPGHGCALWIADNIECNICWMPFNLRLLIIIIFLSYKMSQRLLHRFYFVFRCLNWAFFFEFYRCFPIHTFQRNSQLLFAHIGYSLFWFSSHFFSFYRLSVVWMKWLTVMQLHANKYAWCVWCDHVVKQFSFDFKPKSADLSHNNIFFFN